MKKYDVFISHSSKDRETAKQICESLESKGLFCWIAPRNLTGGSEWSEEIPSAIESSRFFLILYSENSAQSIQVEREVGIAGNTDIQMIPIRIDKTELEGSYLYYLSGSQWLIFSDVNKCVSEVLDIVMQSKANNNDAVRSDTAYLPDIQSNMSTNINNIPPSLSPPLPQPGFNPNETGRIAVLRWVLSIVWLIIALIFLSSEAYLTFIAILFGVIMIFPPIKMNISYSTRYIVSAYLISLGLLFGLLYFIVWAFLINNS